MHPFFALKGRFFHWLKAIKETIMKAWLLSCFLVGLSSFNVLFAQEGKIPSSECTKMMNACDILLNKATMFDPTASKTVFEVARESSVPSMKCRAMLICTLAEAAKGKRDEYLRFFDAMIKTFPDNPMTAVATVETLTDVCLFCSGTGLGKSKCIKCGGVKTCQICKGLKYKSDVGFNKTTTKQTCTACNGEGKCPTCSGLGYTEITCKECKGTCTAVSQKLAAIAMARELRNIAMQCYVQSPQKQGTVDDILARARYTITYNQGKQILSSVKPADTLTPSYISTLKIVESLKADELEESIVAKRLDDKDKLRRLGKKLEKELIVIEAADVEAAALMAKEFIRVEMQKGDLLAAEYIKTEKYPMRFFVGELTPNKGYSRRHVAWFKFKYLTQAGFERWNIGPVNVAYRSGPNRWEVAFFGEHSITGIPYHLTKEGDAAISDSVNNAVAIAFAELGSQKPKRMEVEPIQDKSGLSTKSPFNNSRRMEVQSLKK